MEFTSEKSEAVPENTQSPTCSSAILKWVTILDGPTSKKEFDRILKMAQASNMLQQVEPNFEEPLLNVPDESLEKLREKSFLTQEEVTALLDGTGVSGSEIS